MILMIRQNKWALLYVTEVVAEEVCFADSKKENSSSNPFENNTFGTDNFDVTSGDDLPF